MKWPYRLKILTIGLLVSASCGISSAAHTSKPNILLMMVDDLGFSDFGCYGSEIKTPNIDHLATNGLRFSQFYNTGKCASSRMSLMSGLYPTQAGNESLSRATTIPAVLQEAGYFTSMSGKWHLSKQPTDFGFQRFWGHLSGTTDYFKGNESFRLNGKPWSDFDEDFYTTDVNVDYAIEFIEEALAEKKPFFHYIAFNAPHYPLQAPKKDIQKYINSYDDGWDAIRKARFEKQKKQGLFPNSMELPPLPAHMPEWKNLTDQQRNFEAFRMAIFAAMVDRVDQNIGRLVHYMKKKGVLDNTLIILCSDNGACPFERSKKLEIPPWKRDSFYMYDASWATVGNTPLLNYKQTQHEGGISSPLIVYWPGKINRKGRWEREPGHLIDIMATCIDVSGGRYPENRKIQPLQEKSLFRLFKPVNRKIQPLQGKSLFPLFKGEQRDRHDELYFQYKYYRALRKDDWKLVSFHEKRWELYNIVIDRCEQQDLAADYPKKVEAMTKRWHELAEHTDLLPRKSRKPVSNSPAIHFDKEWHNAYVARDWKRPDFD